jgi:hypothetical protein
VAAVLLLSLSGCAAPGGSASGPLAVGPQAGGPEAGPQPTPTQAAIRAFFSICAPLSPARIAEKAQGFGFIPAPPNRSPAKEMLQDKPGIVFVRPGSTPPVLLHWDATARSCTLFAGEVEPEAGEREVERMLAALSENGLVVERIPSSERRPASLVSLHVVRPRQLGPGETRMLGVFRPKATTDRLSLTLMPVVPPTAPAPPQHQGPVVRSL